MRTLVSKAQRGDSEAFIKLFSTYEKELYRIAFLNVKNEADIERMARLAKSVGEKHPYFILKYYYQYSFKEIGKLLNQPQGTAKTILYRALGKLREKAKKEGFDEKFY